MNNRVKNILLFCAVVLFFHSMAEAGPLVADNTAEIHAAEKKSSQSTHPLDHRNVFNIHHQGENGQNVLNLLSALNVISDTEEETARYSFVEFAIQQFASVYLQIYVAIDRILTLKKLLFPFHSFL